MSKQKALHWFGFIVSLSLAGLTALHVASPQLVWVVVVIALVTKLDEMVRPAPAPMFPAPLPVAIVDREAPTPRPSVKP